MSKPASLPQADMDRVFKSLKRAGYEHAKVVFRLEKKEIEVNLGESAGMPDKNPFDED